MNGNTPLLWEAFKVPYEKTRTLEKGMTVQKLRGKIQTPFWRLQRRIDLENFYEGVMRLAVDDRIAVYFLKSSLIL